jgi:hypothetical protein
MKIERLIKENERLKLKYEDIIIPDKKLKEIKSQLSKLPQK